MIDLRSSGLICACLLFSGAALAQPVEGTTKSVRYKCDSKQSLQADYSTPAGRAPRVVITTSKPPKSAKATEGKAIAPAKTSWTMSETAVGSGNYEDSRKTMAWHSRGAEGHLTDLKTHNAIRCTESASSR